mmetsp:Transcript_14856/g.60401  ORF Transcript_14856/g.60401 Transcript_14856/m.60401 type:complete len:347 (-) Transcript_14856:2483-3523(-)
MDSFKSSVKSEDVSVKHGFPSEADGRAAVGMDRFEGYSVRSKVLGWVCSASGIGIGRDGNGTAKCRLRMKVLYDGTDFQGWQAQTRKGARSVQGVLQEAVSTRFQKPTQVVGASRTDSGVHALGQVAHFDVDEFQDEEQIARAQFALNRMLAADVRVTNMEVARPPTGKESSLPFHAIFDSRGKVYSYSFQLGRFVNPMERRRRALQSQKCDLNLLAEALHKFVGTHDFTSFANRANKGPAAVQPVKCIRSVELIDEGQGAFRVQFDLDGALHRMLRNVMGMSFAVASKRYSLDDIDEIFELKDRRNVPKAADACGLCLENVYYDTVWQPQPQPYSLGERPNPHEV